MARAYWRLYVSAIGNGSTLVNVAELKFYDASNTQIATTSGSATASSSFTGSANAMAPNAFDGNVSSVWSSFSGAPQWVGCQFTSPVDVASFSITCGTGSQINNSPIDFQLQYSDDGSTWTTLYSYLGVSWASANQVQTFTAANAAPSSIGITWRLLITATQSSGLASVAEWKLYDDSLNLITPSRFAAFASSSVDGTGAGFNAFDGSGATAWKTYGSAPSTGSPQWLAYRFPTAQRIGRFCITNENANLQNSPTSVALQYSYDESSWTTVGTYTFTWTATGQTSCQTLVAASPAAAIRQPMIFVLT